MTIGIRHQHAQTPAHTALERHLQAVVDRVVDILAREDALEQRVRTAARDWRRAWNRLIDIRPRFGMCPLSADIRHGQSQAHRQLPLH